MEEELIIKAITSFKIHINDRLSPCEFSRTDCPPLGPTEVRSLTEFSSVLPAAADETGFN